MSKLKHVKTLENGCKNYWQLVYTCFLSVFAVFSPWPPVQAITIHAAVEGGLRDFHNSIEIIWILGIYFSVFHQLRATELSRKMSLLRWRNILIKCTSWLFIFKSYWFWTYSISFSIYNNELIMMKTNLSFKNHIPFNKNTLTKINKYNMLFIEC